MLTSTLNYYTKTTTSVRIFNPSIRYTTNFTSILNHFNTLARPIKFDKRVNARKVANETRRRRKKGVLPEKNYRLREKERDVRIRTWKVITALQTSKFVT